jgi:hypothetical protein
MKIETQFFTKTTRIHGFSPNEFSNTQKSLFLQQNDYWIIRYHGHTALLKSTRGLQYLAALLRDPDASSMSVN